MKKEKLFFMLLFCTQLLISQNTFSKTYSFLNGNEKGKKIITINNDYYFIGAGIEFDTIDNDVYYSPHYFQVKLDSKKNVVKINKGEWYQKLHSINNFNDTLFILERDISKNKSFWKIHKYNNNFDTLNTVIYDGFEHERQYPISMQVKDGYYYFGSYSSSGKVLFIKSDRNGNIIKKTTFAEFIDTSKLFEVSDLSQTTDENFVFIAYQAHAGKDANVLICKFDVDLNMIWVKESSEINTSIDIRTPYLTIAKDGGFVISRGIDLSDSITIKPEKYGGYCKWGTKFCKYDKNGNEIWQDISYNQRIPGYWAGQCSRETITKLVTARNGDILAVGIIDHLFREPGVTGWMCRYSPDGKMKWKHYYVDPIYSKSGKINDMVETENGNIVCIGEIEAENGEFNNSSRTWLLRVDYNGCVTKGCECVPDSITRVYATADEAKILVNSSNYWQEASWSMMSSDVSSNRYKLSYYLIKENYAYGLLKSNTDEGKNWDTTGVLLRQIDQKVWTYYDNHQPKNYEYKLLYDFSLEVGDTFRSQIFEDEDFFLKVEETDTIILEDGSKRKRLKLSCSIELDTINYSGYGIREWIEGIGDTKGLLSIGGSCLTDHNTSLLCFSQNGNIIWDNPDIDDCWITKGEDIVNKAFRIYPNPIRDVINVQLNEGFNATEWSIFNLVGEKVRQGYLNSQNDFTISDMSVLNIGIYILCISNKSNDILSNKFVIVQK